jgi:thiamine-phosphate pyrophosphorylase
MELSPAVERVQEAARHLAQSQGTEELLLSHWLLALLEDEDGKPAVLLDFFGIAIQAIRDHFQQAEDIALYIAPMTESLFANGREKAINIRGESTLTTDFLFLAVLDSDPGFRNDLELLGISVTAIENHLRPDYMVTHDDLEEQIPSFVITETPADSEVMRIIDANLNRSRESLRILDDYARFVLNDRVLTEALKTLRHDLVQSSSRLKTTQLLGSRDTPDDVGVDLTTSREYIRDSASNVALVNFKRLQESLRSVEEFSKVLGDELCKAIEQIRYRSYTLEAVFHRGVTARERLKTANLYALLTGSKCACTLDWTILEAAEGGVSIFQLREKELNDRELLERARRVRRWTREAEAIFIMNDRPDLAKLAEADGVHLGQDDLSVSAARKILGPDALIGVSTHNLEQVRRAVLDGADYLGVGPIFPSKTKHFEEFVGLEFLREAVQETDLPCFALGGINLQNLQEVKQAGGKRIAVSAVLCESDEPRVIATQLRLGLLG